MHSGISVIAQYSHERRVNLPNDNGHPFAGAQRRSPTRSEESPGAFTRLVHLLLASCYPHPPISTQTDQECFGIPRFPLWLSLQLHDSSPRAIRWYSVSPCAPITRRNAHLVRGRGPIMVSNHSKLLSTHGFSRLKRERRHPLNSSPPTSALPNF